MKILHIIPTLHPGGAEKFTIDLCNALSKDNEVILCIFYPVTDEMFMAKEISKKIKIVSLNKKSGLDIKIFYKMYKLIKDEKVQIVNTHLGALVYSFMSVLFTKAIFFHTVHTLANKEAALLNRKIYEILFQRFSIKPIAISKEVLKSIKNEYTNKSNILIENGTKAPLKTIKIKEVIEEMLSYKSNAETKIFVIISSITPVKNHTMLIEAFNDLVSFGENIALCIIGNDPTKSKDLERRLKSQAKKNIFFLGIKKNIADYLSCADAFCLSSLYEGLPIALLESLSSGVVPICTPAGGISDVISKEIGFVANGFSKDEYIDEINNFLSLSSDELTVMRKNCIDVFYQKYDISFTAARYYTLYKSLVDEQV